METRIIFSQIKKHPLRNDYMLFCPIAAIPPFFGTKRECLQHQIHFERKIQDSYLNLSKAHQDRLKELGKKYGICIDL